MATAIGGRKYGIGDYGLLTYDLGPAVMHPWLPSAPVEEPWVPAPPPADPWASAPPPTEPWVPVYPPVYQSLET